MYNELLFSHEKNEMLFATTWIDLEIVILREMSDRESKYMISHVAFKKKATNELIYKTEIELQM